MLDFTAAEYSTIGCILIDARCFPSVREVLPTSRLQVTAVVMPMRQLAGWQTGGTRLTPWRWGTRLGWTMLSYGSV